MPRPQVEVAQIGADADRSDIGDGVAYLALHEIDATARVTETAGRTLADVLLRTARDREADLVVAGG